MVKVLVVDDDSGLRMSVRSALEVQAGRFEIDEAFDGVNALEKIKLKRPDIVLLDVDMPRKNGLDTLNAIKEKDPSVIVIMMTAYATIEDAIKTT